MHRFPHGDAPSNRMLAMAKSMRYAGYQPLVIGNGELSHDCKDVKSSINFVDDIPYTTIRSKKDSIFGRLARRIFQTWFLARAVSRVGLTEVRSIVTTQGTVTLGLLVLAKFIWKKPLVVDCMEWFEPHQFKCGIISPRYIIFLYKFHFLSTNASRLICISKFLSDHFRRKGKNYLTLPPQVDVDVFDPHSEVISSERLELFYAGTAAKKDHLHTVLAGLSLLNRSELSRIRFTIAGPSPSDVNALLYSQGGDVSQLAESLRLIGRISRSQVISELSRMHFTVLLRPVSRYSSAGFPSKIPESLAAGTPVIVNLTSDLDSYLRDGEDSLIVENCSSEAFAVTLRRALALNASDINRMIAGARHCALRNFDYRVYQESMEEFFRGDSESIPFTAMK